ncbi:unnamed protein product [Paramecium octaurelia]|uniref:Uncharacterized protein n=1 Tax=Paramecium octaurelia TaxID=43137 RepID=A0A8S1YSQ9_PAROT|nr:unnamed protein product [Paramecium octaurelia]
MGNWKRRLQKQKTNQNLGMDQKSQSPLRSGILRRDKQQILLQKNSDLILASTHSKETIQRNIMAENLRRYKICNSINQRQFILINKVSDNFVSGSYQKIIRKWLSYN